MMEVTHGYDCEFCGQFKPIVCTTWGCFCKDCFQIMIDEFTEAVETLEKEEVV
jgi:hypothetical protein